MYSFELVTVLSSDSFKGETINSKYPFVSGKSKMADMCPVHFCYHDLVSKKVKS